VYIKSGYKSNVCFIEFNLPFLISTAAECGLESNVH